MTLKRWTQLPERLLSRYSFLLVGCALTGKSIYLNLATGIHYGPKLGGIVSITILSLLIALVPAVLANKRRAGLEAWLNLVTTILIQVDLLYFRYSNQLPSITIAGEFAHLASITTAAISLLSLSDLLLYLDLPLFFAWAHRRTVPSTRIEQLVLIAGLVGALSTRMPLTHPIATLTDKLSQPGVLQTCGILHYHAQDIVSEAIQALTPRKPINGQEFSELAVFLQPHSANHSKYLGTMTGKNLLVIQVEALQGFVIGRRVAGREITPNLNRLLKESLYFEDFYQQTDAGKTSDAELLAQAAIFPLKDRISFWELKGNEFNTIARLLRNRGYGTYSLHGYSSQFYNRRQIHPLLGFNHSMFLNDFPDKDIIGWGISDKTVLKETATLLSSAKKPFYAFTITLSSHYPYDGHYSTRNPLPAYASDEMLDHYFQAIHYVDEAIGDLFTTLEANGLLSETIVAIYGDHYAIPFKARRGLNQFTSLPDTAASWIKHQTVPFIIRLPTKDSARISKTGGQIDIAPTLLGLLGVTSRSLHWFGHDLLDPSPGRAIFRDGSWVDKRRIYVVKDGASPPYAVDRLNGRDVPLTTLTSELGEVHTLLKYSDLINRFNLIPRLDPW